MHLFTMWNYRKCRITTILKNHGKSENSLFVGTARYPGKEPFMSVATRMKELRVPASSVKARRSEPVEKIAIALSILRSHGRNVSKCKPAIRN